jgi:hypothetical protein
VQTGFILFLDLRLFSVNLLLVLLKRVFADQIWSNRHRILPQAYTMDSIDGLLSDDEGDLVRTHDRTL